MGVFNNLVVFIVINNIKNSVGSCNFLVKQLALSDIITCLGFLMCTVPGLIGEFDLGFWHIPQHICSLIAALSLIGMGTGAFITLLVSSDRCYAVFCPKRYILNQTPWAKISVILVWIVTVSFMLVAIRFSDPSHIVPVCLPPFAFTQTIGRWWNCANIITNLFVLLIYLVILVHTKVQSVRNDHRRRRRNFLYQKHKQVIMSLTVIITIHLTTWFTAHITTVAVILLRVSRTTGIMAVAHMGILATLNINLDVFIYYWMSEDFRESMRKLWFYRWIAQSKSIDRFILRL